MNLCYSPDCDLSIDLFVPDKCVPAMSGNATFFSTRNTHVCARTVHRPALMYSFLLRLPCRVNDALRYDTINGGGRA